MTTARTCSENSQQEKEEVRQEEQCCEIVQKWYLGAKAVSSCNNGSGSSVHGHGTQRVAAFPPMATERQSGGLGVGEGRL